MPIFSGARLLFGATLMLIASTLYGPPARAQEDHTISGTCLVFSEFLSPDENGQLQDT